MRYCSVRDLRNAKKEVWDNLEKEGELIVLNNGKPRALIFDVTNENVDMMIKAVRQARAMISFNQMREKAQINGFMSEEEINKEINAARKAT
ncbi:MAG: hypothetical protein IJ790_01220 [Lachnospiraceae bacterium]|nr:hypothetical protein [Lachnospiraceae bacterium]